jgi:hypothetical protein
MSISNVHFEPTPPVVWRLRFCWSATGASFDVHAQASKFEEALKKQVDSSMEITGKPYPRENNTIFIAMLAIINDYL